MPTVSLTTEQKQEAVDAFAKYGNKERAAEALGLTRGAYCNRFRQGVKAGLDEAIVHPAPQGHTVKGVSSYYNGDGTLLGQWVKTKVGEPSPEELAALLLEAFDDYQGPHQPIAAPLDTSSDLATIFPVADAHFGLYAYGQEAGEDYDLSIADATNRDAFTLRMPASV